MIYNDGKVHSDIYNKPEQELDKIAEEFSEGNKELKEVLLNMWKNNVKTIGCCNGHEGKNNWYLVFQIGRNSVSTINKLLEYIVNNEKNNIELDFGITNDSFSCYITSEEEEKENILKIINNNIVKNKEEKGNENLLYASFIYSFASTNNLHFRYIIQGNDMYLGFFKKGTVLLFQDNIEDLEDYIEYIKETEKLPIKPFKCNKESLNKFLAIMYPNEEIFNTKVKADF